FFSSRRRHTRSKRDWSSDVCSSDLIEHDWLDREFIDIFTVGFDEIASYCRQWTPAKTAEVSGVPERSIRQAAEWWGTARSSFLRSEERRVGKEWGWRGARGQWRGKG